MENQKIKLHFPLAVSDSSYYTNLAQYPPLGYEYIDKKSGLIGNTKMRGVFRLAKAGVRNLSSSFRLSRPLYARSNIFSPENIHHFAHCIPSTKKSNGIDYIVDIEGVWQLAIGKLSPSVKKKILANLSRDNCKAILPWTRHSYTEFVKEFPELETKTHILRPAVPLMQMRERVVDPKSFMILYVARDFKLKNGPMTCEILNSFVEHMKKYTNTTINAVVVSTVDKKTKNKYPNIIFKDLMPKEDLNNYYSLADVFFYPSPVDTFGFSLIESMSFGTPVIAMKTKHTKAVSEIVVNGVNGFVFTKDNFLDKSVTALYHMVTDRGFWKMLSKNCINIMLDGPYSISYRNSQLKEILRKCTTK